MHTYAIPMQHFSHFDKREVILLSKCSIVLINWCYYIIINVRQCLCTNYLKMYIFQRHLRGQGPFLKLLFANANSMFENPNVPIPFTSMSTLFL